MDRLYSAEESRQVDRNAIHAYGLDGYGLMRSAAQAAADELTQRWPEVSSVVIVTGKGNNAGDGYVLAQMLQGLGIAVQVLQLGEAPSSGDAQFAVRDAQAADVPVSPFEGSIPTSAQLIVDALLGTGATGALRDAYRQAVQVINAAAQPVFALDLPTGLNADTGGALGESEAVIRADATVSFITRKMGQYTGLGLEVCGQLIHKDLAVPRGAYDGGIEWLSEVPSPVELTVNAYKHARGHVLVVGGDLNYGGATLLTSEACLRAGAGMVTVLTRAEHRPAILARRPEVMVVDPTFALDDLLARADAVVIGPGLGRTPWGEALYRQVVEAWTGPLLIDADGLFFLQRYRAQHAQISPVITPHTGEAAMLLECAASEVQRDRPAAARALAGRYRASVALKGAGTVVADEARMSICSLGNPSMASAGMGDVLSGVAGAMLARSQDAYTALQSAVAVHAAAGDAARNRIGGQGLVASDLFPELARLV